MTEAPFPETHKHMALVERAAGRLPVPAPPGQVWVIDWDGELPRPACLAWEDVFAKKEDQAHYRAAAQAGRSDFTPVLTRISAPGGHYHMLHSISPLFLPRCTGMAVLQELVDLAKDQGYFQGAAKPGRVWCALADLAQDAPGAYVVTIKQARLNSLPAPVRELREVVRLTKWAGDAWPVLAARRVVGNQGQCGLFTVMKKPVGTFVGAPSSGEVA